VNPYDSAAAIEELGHCDAELTPDNSESLDSDEPKSGAVWDAWGDSPTAAEPEKTLCRFGSST